MKFSSCTITLLTGLIFFACKPVPPAAPPLQAELLLDAKAILGEGAIWHPTENMLYWVDIEGKHIHLYDPETQSDLSIEVSQRVGTLVPDAKGGVLLALEDGIYHFDMDSDKLSLVAHPADHKPGVRFNDGKCDPAGRFWVGSIAPKEEAFLYRMDGDFSTRTMLDKVTTSNGIVWSLDKKTMYYIDTPTLTVRAFDYDNATGDISNPRVAISVPDSLGYPDGMTIDAEGKLWVAHWGGAAVIRWDPESGNLMQKVSVPAPNTTSCAFGGENMETLFITTASIDVENSADFPLSGGLFAVKPGVKGVKASFFQGNLP